MSHAGDHSDWVLMNTRLHWGSDCCEPSRTTRAKNLIAAGRNLRAQFDLAPPCLNDDDDDAAPKLRSAQPSRRL